MSGGWFVTGTDTGVGKTLVAASLLAALGSRGARCIGMKPVASGCVATPEGLRNDDALRLKAQATVAADYADINPYAFAPAVSPHLAAQAAGVEIRLDVIHRHFERLRARADLVVVEGAGGFRAPLSASATMAELASDLGLPVILVVGMRLGCLSHALLTVESIAARRLRLAGWVANCIDPHMALVAENIATLGARIAAPHLGTVPFASRPTPAPHRLDVGALLSVPTI